MSQEEEKTRKSNPDPPQEERFAVGPRIPETEEWVRWWGEGVRAKSRFWKQKILRPKKFPPRAAKDAAPKYKSKLTEAMELGVWERKMGKITEEEFGTAVEAVRAEDYSRGAERRTFKMHARIEEQRALRLYAAQRLDLMPVETADERARKMVAARDTNIAIGLFMKGVIDAAECRRRIEAATG